MRIAQVTLRFDAPGGVETTVRELSRRLHDAGESVEVYASDLYDEGRWERRSGYAPTVDGVRVRRFPVYRRLIPGLTMPLMVGLVTALNGDRPEIIHAHSHRYGHVLESASVARTLRVPLVVSAHYHPAHPGETRLKQSLLKVQDLVFGIAAYRTARAVIVETQQEADQVASFVHRDRIRVIPPGIDLAVWQDGAQERPPEGLPDRFLLYAGRIASNKGLSTLVEALGRIPPAERLPLVLIGKDWGQRAAIQATADRAGVGELLHWLGHLDDVGAYRATFRRATVFVLPSDYEAFGLVLLEAMAAGVPIVATSVGGVPEVLEGGRAGRLVPPNDPVALSEAIRSLTGDRPASTALARAGRSRVEAFSWDRAIAAHRTLFQELVASPGRAS